MPRDVFSHKHPKLLAKVVIYKLRYAIKTNRLDALERYSSTCNKGLFWDVNSKSLKRKRAVKIMIDSFMVRRDFHREEMMLVHVQRPGRLNLASAACSGWENNIERPPAVCKAWEDAGEQGTGMCRRSPHSPIPKLWRFRKKAE